MNLKLTSTLLLALVLGTAAAPLLHAQDQATNPAPADGKRGKGARGGKGAEGRGPAMMNPEARVEMLDRQLKLTADQKAKLTDIFTKARDDMKDEMQGAQGARGGGDRTANREKMQAAREKMQQAMQATRDQVAAVLTDEQKKKFEQMPAMGDGGARGGGKAGPGAGKRKKSDTN